MRHILASADEIGNHSFDHPKYPGYRELAWNKTFGSVMQPASLHASFDPHTV